MLPDLSSECNPDAVQTLEEGQLQSDLLKVQVANPQFRKKHIGDTKHSNLEFSLNDQVYLKASTKCPKFFGQSQVPQAFLQVLWAICDTAKNWANSLLFAVA